MVFTHCSRSNPKLTPHLHTISQITLTHYTCIIQSPPFNFCFVLPEAPFSSSVKVLPFPQNYPTPKTQLPTPSCSLHQFILLFSKLSIDLKLKGLVELLAKFNESKKILGFWRINQERERSKEASYVTEDKRVPSEPVHGGGRCGRGLSKTRETMVNIHVLPKTTVLWILTNLS